MAVYTRLSSSEIADIVARYAIGELVSVEEIAEGVENSNYLIVTKGAEDREGVETKSILTIYEKRMNVEELPFFLGVMEHLASKGISCPIPRYSREGKNYIRVKGKAAAIVSFLEGHSVNNITNSRVASLGKAVAQMHLAAESFDESRKNNLSVGDWLPLLKDIGEEAANRYSAGLYDMLCDECEYLVANWPKYGDIPRGVIHADLFPDNVFFQGDEVSGIIDFYFACNDFFLYDIAIILNAWCFENHAEFNITKAGMLLNNYYDNRSMQVEELELLPVLCRGAALRFLLTRLYDWENQNPDALVRVKNPDEYIKKLRFHQRVRSYREYGIYV